MSSYNLQVDVGQSGVLSIVRFENSDEWIDYPGYGRERL